MKCYGNCPAKTNQIHIHKDIKKKVINKLYVENYTYLCCFILTHNL